MNKVEKHLRKICDEAGLNSMYAIIGEFVYERDNIDDEVFLALDADDIFRWYDIHIVRGVNAIEDELLEAESEDADH